MIRDDITALYRYTTADRAICILTSKKIFSPSHKKFNDPFDGAIEFDKDITAEEFVQYAFRQYKSGGWSSVKRELDKYIEEDCTLKKEKKKEINEFAEEFAEGNKKSGIVCLSEDSSSSLMFSHYADQHKGVCIGFSRTPNNKLGDDDTAHMVLYSDLYPDARFNEIFKADKTLTSKLLCTKAKDWAYEKEWRLFTDKADIFVDIPGDIKEVVLGCRIAKEHEEILAKECRKQDIPIFKYEMIPKKFQFKRVQL